MAENEINEGSDKVRISDRTERTSKHTADEAVSDSERAEGYEQRFTTFSDNDEDQSFKAILPTADAFGIDFGDGTVETAKGKVTKPHTSEFFEAKAQGAIAAFQNLDQQPKYQPDQLIAANVTPNNPVVSDATLPNPDEVNDLDLPDNAVVQLPDFGKMLKDTGESIKGAGESLIHPYKNELNKFLDPDAAQLAMNKFPRLSWYAHRNATIGPQLLLGIVRNETEHYMIGKDDMIQDAPVSLGAEAPLQKNPTIGPAQVSLKNQKALAEKYPDLFGDSKDYPKTSLSPYFATLLAGALLDQNIQKFEKWDKQPPSEEDLKDKDTRLLYEHAYPKWKEGHYTEAIIRSYNPGDGSRHVRNVQRHIDTLNNRKP